MPDYATTPPPERLADRVQLRTAFTVEHGDVVRFMAQLEYWLDGEWQPVVRYDHDEDPAIGHDITEEEFEVMDERIADLFDRVRALLDEDLAAD